MKELEQCMNDTKTCAVNEYFLAKCLNHIEDYYNDKNVGVDDIYECLYVYACVCMHVCV